MPEVLPSGTEEHEEEEKEETVSSLPPQGLRSRGPAVLAEVKSVGQSIVVEGAVVAEQPEEVTERAKVKVPSQTGVLIQLTAFSAQERVEVQQLSSPSVMMSASQVVEPSPTTGLLSGKAPVTEVSLVQVSSSSSEEHGDYSGDEVNFGDKPALPDASKFSHISKEEMQGGCSCKGSIIKRDHHYRGHFFYLLFFSSYEHCFNTRLTVICRSCHQCRSCNLRSIEE